jgi:hypothetical protein
MPLTIGAYDIRVGTSAKVYELPHPGQYHVVVAFRKTGAAFPCGIQCAITDYTDTNQWRCHNCSCGTTAVGKLMRYYTKIENISTEDPRSNSWTSDGSVSLFAEITTLSRWSSPLPTACPCTERPWFDRFICLPCAIWRSREFWKLVSEQMRYNIFDLQFTRNSTKRGLCADYIWHCIIWIN